MKSEMQEFCLRASVPCGFSDSEGEISTNAAMMELLAFNKDAPEMVALLEKIRTEKSPFYVISNLTFDYKKFYRPFSFFVVKMAILALSFTPTSSCFCLLWNIRRVHSLMQLAQKNPTSCSLIKSGKYCSSRCTVLAARKLLDG